MPKVLAAIRISNHIVGGLAVQPGKREWTVLAGASLPLPDGDDADLAGPVRQLARAIKLHGHQPATLVLGKQQAIVRNVLLPSTDPAELAQMARFEAERHIPFNAERHSVGFHIMRSKGVEGSEVLISAVDGPVVARGLDALTGAGLVPDGITISSACLVNSHLYARGDQGENRTLAIVSIGLDSLGLVFLTQGRVVYAREAATDLRGVLESWIGHRADSGLPAPDLAKLAVAAHMIDCEKLDMEPATMTGADPAAKSGELVQHWINRIGQDIQRTYDFARREMKCPPLEAIVLTGEGAALRHLDQFIGAQTGLPVEVLNPVGGLPGAEKHKFPFHGLEYVIAFGALVGRHHPGAYNIDLTPSAHYKALARKSLARRLAVTGGLLVMALALGAFSFMRFQDIQAQKVAEYAAINTEIKPIFDELRQMRVKTDIIENFIHDPNAALAVLDSVIEAPMIPNEVYLQRIDYTKNNMLTIEGQAKTIEDISQLIAYLNTTGHFIDVIRGPHPPTDLLGHTVFSFKLDCPLKAAAGANEEDPS